MTNGLAPDHSVRLKSVILQGHNYDPSNPLVGVTYDIYWDNFTYNNTYASGMCEGAIAYTYSYADCSGLPYAWTYTYTVDHVTAPVVPTAGASTVACLANAVPPLSVLTCNPPYPPTSYAAYDCMFKTYMNTVLDQSQTTFASFVLDVNTGVGQSFTPSVSGLLTQIDVNIYEKTGNPSFILKVYAGGGITGTPIYSSGGYSITSTGWITIPITGTQPTLTAGTQYTFWLTAYPYNSVRLSIGNDVYAGGVCFDACEQPVVTDVCGTVIPTPTPAISGTYNGCSGTRIYTYTYADCAGLSSDWVYTYTISPPVVTMPTAGGSIVACPIAAVAPTPPIVTDNCGRTLSVSAGVAGTLPSCSGTMTYTFTYTDCANATYTWVYTYTISAPVVSMPAGGGSTIQCVANATLPVPPTVTDNCGRTLSVGSGAAGADPSCNGLKTWTFTYTDCAAATYNWVYTYTINDNTAPVINTPIVINRPLPTANLNNVAGVNRSNVAWAEDPNPPDFDGDDFTMPAGSSWTINKITVWAVAGSMTANPNIDLSSLFSSISLYGGVAPVASWGTHGTTYTNSPANTLMSGNFVGNATNNPNIVITPATYADLSTYQGGSGAFSYLWKVEFNNLNWVVPGGQKLVYGVNCPKTSPSGPYWFNHYSNAAKGGVVADQADGLFTGTTVPASGTWNVTIYNPVTGGWWDKGSDGNIVVQALQNTLTAECDAVPVAPVLTATDNCESVTVNYAETSAAGSCPSNYTLTRTWTAPDACGNSTSLTQTITVADNTPPVITCPIGITVNMNAGCTYVGSIGIANATDNCTATSAIVISNNAPTFFNAGETVVTWTATDLCGKFSTCTQTVTVVANTISGILTYYNTANTAMNNVIIDLKQGGTVMHSATTNTSGAYTFSGVCAGTYDVVFTTTKPVGGINVTDAAQVNAWYTGPYSIEKVRFFAGDVVGTTNRLEPVDASRILSYFVNLGVPAFSSKWTFWKNSETTSSQNPLPNVLQLAVAGNMVQNFYGLATGDFNRSFTPGGAKSVVENVSLNIGGNMMVEPGVEFELPVTAGMDMEIGAVSLILNLPADQLEVTGVYLGSDPTIPMEYAVVGNELRIGWHSMIPASLGTGETLLTLKLKTTDALAQGETIRLSLTSDPLNELADGYYNTIPNASLFVDEIGGTTTGISGGSLNSNLLLTSYPNPFTDKTTFDFNTPKDGRVVLVISNMLGSQTAVLLDEFQTAGSHTYTVDLSNYAVGVYTATLRLQSNNDVNTRTIKVIRK